MKKVDANTIQQILEILEAYLNQEKKELQLKIKNLKKINVKILTDKILSETEKGSTYQTQDIIHRILQIIQD